MSHHPHPVNLEDPKYYINRELNWLKFNERVLEEALDTSHPLLERLKFIAIFSSNLDEFFMIRVAGLKAQIDAGVRDLREDQTPPEEILRQISVEVHRLVQIQSDVLANDILPRLHKRGIRLRTFSKVKAASREKLYTYFREYVFPMLTPFAIDVAHPKPPLSNLGLNLLVEMRTPYKRDNKVAIVHISSVLPRFIEVPDDDEHYDFVLIEDLISEFIQDLFPGFKILETSEFRLTRNADLEISEAEADDLLKLVERELRKRNIGAAIRLEVRTGITPASRELLRSLIRLDENDLYDVPSYLNLSNFMQFMKFDRPELKDEPFTPALHPRLATSRDLFKTIREGDILLHHPYDSFNHTVEFVEAAANDPAVLVIKQTLYRTTSDSPIVNALKNAAMNGKRVTALIELKARFDEQNNIGWARELDKAGVNVVYGVMGLKTHCKACMVIRQEEGKMKRYLHLSTGNYHNATARIYTDLALFTCDEGMTEDATDLFNLLTGYSNKETWRRFMVAPNSLRTGLLKQIQACICDHSPENPSHITMIINNLVDGEMIRALYEASAKGIKVDLIIRGICCLRPGMKGVSENITVRSIVGRFLEHTRIYYFRRNGEEEIYIGSADMMRRNLDRRVEVVFPLLNPEIKARVKHIMRLMLEDNVKSRLMDREGNYHRHILKEGEKAVDSQELLLEESEERQKDIDTTRY